MAIGLATTTISIQRYATVDAQGNPLDAYDEAPLTTIAKGVRAVIGSSSGSADREGANRAEVTSRLLCDTGRWELRSDDLVVDEPSGRTYRVDWADVNVGLGLDHVEAGLIFAG